MPHTPDDQRQIVPTQRAYRGHRRCDTLPIPTLLATPYHQAFQLATRAHPCHMPTQLPQPFTRAITIGLVRQYNARVAREAGSVQIELTLQGKELVVGG